MQSKVKTKPQTAVEPRYPRLMQVKTEYRASDLVKVVLFTRKNTGVVVIPSGYDKLGQYSDQWCENQFEDFDGIVELSN